MRIVLFQPDIPQNTGTILRLAACLGIGVDIIEPCGFVWNNEKLKRAGMDYLDHVDLTRHMSWNAYLESRSPQRRLILLTTKTDKSFLQEAYSAQDDLLFGSESAGVPLDIHALCPIRLKIPMNQEVRSLNVAISCALVVGEALRQTNAFPK